MWLCLGEISVRHPMATLNILPQDSFSSAVVVYGAHAVGLFGFDVHIAFRLLDTKFSTFRTTSLPSPVFTHSPDHSLTHASGYLPIRLFLTTR